MSLTTSAHWMYNPGGGGFYGYEIDDSLRFNDNDSAYLNRTPASAGNRKTWTWSGWLKRSNLGLQGIFEANHSKDNQTALLFENGHTLLFTDRPSNNRNIDLRTNALFRDVSAWYHIVVRVDTTQATASNRVRLYVNGEQITSFSTSSYPSQNYNVAFWNNTNSHRIGYQQGNSGNLFDGYMSDINFIDGQSLAPTSFGETKSGIWIPKAYSGSYGTNGFHLEFAGNASDTSGNGNNWTANNITYSDYLIDTPTNNFATHNSLASLGGMTFFEGNTKVRHADIAAYNHARSTMGMTSGKWYWEWYNSASSGDAPNLLSGIVNDNVRISTSNGYVGQNTNSYGWNGTNGARYYNGSNIGTISIPTGDSSGVYMVAYDADNGKLYFGKNGTWANSGNPAAGTGALFTSINTDITWYPAGYTINNDGGRWRDVVVNHGQDSTFANNKTAGGNSDDNGIGDFYYSPPSGFVAICTANLPDPAADPAVDETPEDYFNTVLWTGNGSTQSISVGFQPDAVWIKRRNIATNHNIFDSIRGTNKKLYTNLTNAEFTDTNALTSFDSDGFTVGADAEAGGASGSTYVGWNWKASGTGVSNTDGSITSTVSLGATSQQNWFSVVGYQGNGTPVSGALVTTGTVGHGLGRKPDVIIVKDRSAAYNWNAWFNTFTGSQVIYPNLTNAKNSDPNVWSGTEPTSSVFYVSNVEVNTLSNNYIAYCFANAEGLCKVGSYVGNSSTDGTFLYTGFRPAWWLVKATISGEPWMVMDNKRDAYNLNDAQLQAQSNRTESNDGNGIDFLSNGIKMRSNIGNWNTNGVEYIYLAIAEQPFKYANAR